MSIQLSFIMPTYNSADYISETLDSLMASIGKHHKSCEVICVDDGSTDKTVSIVKQYQSQFPFIRLIQNEHGGVSLARNTALEVAQGRYVTCVDSDDLYAKDFLDYFLTIEEDFDVLFTDVGLLDKKKKYYDILPDEKLDLFKSTLRIGDYKIEPGVAGKFFNMALIKKYKIRYNQELSVSEDLLFNFEFLTKASKVRLDPVLFYNVTGTHSLMYYNEKNLSGQIEFLNKMRELLFDYPESDNKDLLEDKFIINAMTIFIDRYFGPLWLNGTYSLSETAKLLEQTVLQNDMRKAFMSNRLDYSIGNRYVVFRKLLRLRQYKLCLLYNRLMDKVRGFERFRKA